MLYFSYGSNMSIKRLMDRVPSEYFWSSYQINGLGKTSSLCTPHPIYLALGESLAQRQAQYRGLFSEHVKGQLLNDIRLASQSGMALGSDKFKDEMASLTGRRLQLLPSGRKPGWRKNQKQN